MKGKTLVFIVLSVFLLVLAIGYIQEKQDVPIAKKLIEMRNSNKK